jgi:hypothetical protein
VQRVESAHTSSKHDYPAGTRIIAQPGSFVQLLEGNYSKVPTAELHLLDIVGGPVGEAIVTKESPATVIRDNSVFTTVILDTPIQGFSTAELEAYSLRAK